MLYRRAAANKGFLDWGLPDPGRLNNAFVGQTKVIPRCTYCLSDTHTADECPDAPMPKQAALPGSADQKLGVQLTRPVHQDSRMSSVEICRLFNHPILQAPVAVSTAAVMPIFATDATTHIHYLSAGSKSTATPFPDPQWECAAGSRSHLVELGSVWHCCRRRPGHLDHRLYSFITALCCP